MTADSAPGEWQQADTHECALNPALHGWETFDFAPVDLPLLRARLQGVPAFSVHAPLPTPPDYPGSPVTSYLLDPDPAKRVASLSMLRQTIELAAAWHARYVVVHFGGLHSNGLSPQEVSTLAEEAARKLNGWAEACRMPVHIEYAAYNRSFASPEELVALVRRYPHLHICLDVGHLRVGAEILGMDEWRAARLLAPHTRSMHLWTTRGQEDVSRYHHVPVHPSLGPGDGWIDIPGMLELVLAHQPECGIVFEAHGLYNSDPEWQQVGMDWVRTLVQADGTTARGYPEAP